MSISPVVKRAVAYGVDRVIAEALYASARMYSAPTSVVFAVCEAESAFANVWGHDPGGWRPPAGVTKVTQRDVGSYLAAIARGQIARQGIGPMQITSAGLQAEAGGLLANPQTTIEIGVRYLAGLCHAHGVPEGVERYNGSGPAAAEYSRRVMARVPHWHAVLA